MSRFRSSCEARDTIFTLHSQNKSICNFFTLMSVQMLQRSDLSDPVHTYTGHFWKQCINKKRRSASDCCFSCISEVIHILQLFTCTQRECRCKQEATLFRPSLSFNVWPFVSSLNLCLLKSPFHPVQTFTLTTVTRVKEWKLNVCSCSNLTFVSVEFSLPLLSRRCDFALVRFKKTSPVLVAMTTDLNGNFPWKTAFVSEHVPAVWLSLRSAVWQLCWLLIMSPPSPPPAAATGC